MFLFFRKACLLYKTSKIVFSRFIFTICDMGIQGITRGYMGLQGVKRGYRRSQRFTRGYRGYKGLQGVTNRYRGLQRIMETLFYLERLQILFVGLFCIKIKVEEISNF